MSRVGQDMSRVSIRDHTTNPNTDQLYEPLRETLHNPNNILRHAALTPLITRSSFVSKDYRILSPQELQLIVAIFSFRKAIPTFLRTYSCSPHVIWNPFAMKSLWLSMHVRGYWVQPSPLNSWSVSEA